MNNKDDSYKDTHTIQMVSQNATEVHRDISSCEDNSQHIILPENTFLEEKLMKTYEGKK